MIKMNKLTYTALLLLNAVVAFAQQAQREVRPDRFPSESSNGGPEDNFATPGGNTVPVDQYAYILIGVAILFIAYFVYTRRMQMKNA